MTGRTATSVTPQGRDLRKLTLPADPGPILSAPLFRAEKNHVGGPLRYASVQQLWTKYRTKAQVNASIHQEAYS